MKPLVALLFLFAISAPAEDLSISDGNSLWIGMQLAKRLEAKDTTLTENDFLSVRELLGYLKGYLEAAGGWQFYDSNAPFKFPSKGISLRQYKLILEKYLNDHPEELHKDAKIISFAALVNSFPNPDFKAAPQK